MVPRFARPELKAPLARVAARVDEAVEALRPYGRSPLWNGAIAATLALSQASTHLLRAQLVLLGSLAGGGPAEGTDLERFAAGFELLHLFMLVHDDVMDGAAMRRGKPTLRIALSRADPTLEPRAAEGLAIVLGNLLHVQAMRHLQAAGEAAASVVLEGSCRAGAGQFHDVLGMRVIADEEALRRELVDKLAYHGFVAPLSAGLLTARPSADLGPSTAWGEHVGLAFQGVDDLADLLGSPTTTGKDGLRDLLHGSASLPLFLLRRGATESDRVLLDGLAARHSMDPGERAYVYRLVHGSRVASACAGWVRSELEAAARVRVGAFPGAAGEGLGAIEQGLLAYLDRVMADADVEQD
jgi:geranylgeranyl diphosphate synthase type I